MRTQSRRRPRATLAAAAAGTLLAPLLSGCWVGAGGAGSGGDAINVLMVNNPQMVQLQKLTAGHFTKETGIKVNFTVLPENDVRDKISQDFANQAGQYDVATLSNYEIPIYARNEWLHEMDPHVAKDTAYDEQDILWPMRESLTGDDGKLYGQPFYGESSFLMYRKDVLAEKGLTMPARPTWTQIADIAARVDGAEPGMKGICLRGLPGWGELMAPLTTVVNTFGGTWFDQDWKARLDSPEFEKATKFYVDLVREHGESGAAQAGFAECLNNMTQGKVAMWYDATSAAGSLESAKSPVKGKLGYAPRRWRRPTPPAGSTPGPGASRRRPATPTRRGSSSPGPPARSTSSWSATGSAGPTYRPASAPPRTTTRTTGRRPPPSRR
ncbi:Sugar ABC transporter substrate-binding protein OS=Streptomyces fumanus OX=67302 GN=GCM10018772_65110 PE=4 SV=1 [Streptomyces fumanus]